MMATVAPPRARPLPQHVVFEDVAGEAYSIVAPPRAPEESTKDRACQTIDIETRDDATGDRSVNDAETQSSADSIPRTQQFF